MSNKGPGSLDDPFAGFSDNEKYKFSLILAAENAGKRKKVAALMKDLAPSEEDRYDLYLRISEKIAANTPPMIEDTPKKNRKCNLF